MIVSSHSVKAEKTKTSKTKVQRKKTLTKKKKSPEKKPEAKSKKKANRRYIFIAVPKGSDSKTPVWCEVISTGPTCAQHEFDAQYPDMVAWNYMDPFFDAYTEDPGDLFQDGIKTALDLERVEEAAKAEAEKMSNETL